MFVPMLEALAQVQEADFIHRNIKPANIIVRDVIKPNALCVRGLHNEFEWDGGLSFN